MQWTCCIQIDPSATSVFQLEARPSSNSNGCFSSELVREDLLCQSSMGINTESTVRGQSPANRCTVSGPSLERSTMVSSPPVNVVRLLSPHTPRSRPYPGTGVDVPTISFARGIVGRVAHLREYCQTKNKPQSSSWPPGDKNSTNLTTHSFTSGSAGVLNGTEIPFLVL